jgi:hypothetical protein
VSRRDADLMAGDRLVRAEAQNQIRGLVDRTSPCGVSTSSGVVDAAIVRGDIPRRAVGTRDCIPVRPFHARDRVPVSIISGVELAAASAWPGVLVDRPAEDLVETDPGRTLLRKPPSWAGYAFIRTRLLNTSVHRHGRFNASKGDSFGQRHN